jgi:hypothetical protein
MQFQKKKIWRNLIFPKGKYFREVFGGFAHYTCKFNKITVKLQYVNFIEIAPRWNTSAIDSKSDNRMAAAVIEFFSEQIVIEFSSTPFNIFPVWHYYLMVIGRRFCRRERVEESG